jgi:hypothetical protein
VAPHDAAEARAQSRHQAPLARGPGALYDVVNRRDEQVPVSGPREPRAVTRAARRVGVGWWWSVASRGDRGKANSAARRTTGTRRALGTHARHAMHNASSRRESHRAAGAQGHLVDDRAGDTDRCLVRHGSPRNCRLLLEGDHATLDGPGDSDNALGTERFGKSRDAIRGSYEHLCCVVGELPHSGHHLVQVGRMIHGGNRGCQLEG